MCAPDLLRALHIDFQQHVAARFPHCLDPVAARAVKAPKHAGVLQINALGHAGLELILADEMIVLTVDLAGARRTGGVGHRQRQPGMALQQGGNQAGLAAAAGPGNDKKLAAAVRVTRHSAPVHAFARSRPSARRPPGPLRPPWPWTPACWL